MWALYANLMVVKAFNSDAKYDLLFRLLSKYGMLDHLVADADQRLYHDMEMKLKLRKQERTIPYLTGAKLGDKMALVLFLFLI